MVASCIFSCQNYLELPISFYQRRQKDERWPLFCICVENDAIIWPSLELLSWPVSGRAKPDNNVLLSDTGGTLSDISVQNVKVDSFRTELISFENYQIFTLCAWILEVWEIFRDDKGDVWTIFDVFFQLDLKNYQVWYLLSYQAAFRANKLWYKLLSGFKIELEIESSCSGNG